MEVRIQQIPILVIGLELRTSNAEAFQAIPEHWQAFFQKGSPGVIPNKVSQDIFAVYTNFEHEGVDNEGTYSFILGCEVDSIDQVPSGFVATVIRPSARQVFPVPAGQPQMVGEAWREIWSLSHIRKAFVADFEHYRETGEIEILVGVHPSV